ncbi:hypothetical protein EJ08DRAFT_717112 [Tothia fuscella]|uniref:DDE-1 domain-containing protein n=1 Tax=Tothia fuscella TaxID=1048955 RepID=A0A9P4NQA3_9PEZI|nr:hypothetical protein EJ08DRAFT_717112 [Tothia fuscella]
MRFLKYAIKNRILITVYPPYSTHLLQLLDLVLFAPLASYYSTQLNLWQIATGGLAKMLKREFYGLFRRVFESAFTEKNIISL